MAGVRWDSLCASMGWYFACFALSGLCGLVYEVVWLRLSMAAFGVGAPTVSSVLSVFMAGLGLGSLLAGRLVERLRGRRAGFFLLLYALCELGIAGSGPLVPDLLERGHRLFATTWGDVAWGSAGHYLAAGVWIAATLLPFCLLMGATIPLAMAAIGRQFAHRAASSFSYLYLANVAGATAGALLAAFVLIELLGLHRTLWLAAAINSAIAAAALVLRRAGRERAESAPPAPPASGELGPVRLPALLFLTGFTGMAMQVAWIRLFTPHVGTTVYAFAGILAVYLASGAAGTLVYRRRLARGRPAWDDAPLWLLLGATGLLPLWSAIPGIFTAPAPLLGLCLVVVGTAPFCALLGVLTPMLVDRWCAGDPGRAGRAYAVNVMGSILGPLASAYLLLPRMGARPALLFLSLPPLVCGLLAAGRRGPPRRAWTAVLLAPLAATTAFRLDEGWGEGSVVLHDTEASVLALPYRDSYRLLVNGMGMAYRTPITKYMAHLPMAFLERPPRSALAIAFGTGTTFRSLCSWGAAVTAVELVPSVPVLYERFHPDAAGDPCSGPSSRIVIDDGRRFLWRSKGRFDVITVDPPPPVSAAGSSLLYSVEFLELARSRLAPDGVLQHWAPHELETPTGAAIAGAIRRVFPHVRAFRSVEGWGTHLLASARPLAPPTPQELVVRMPTAARKDLVEWFGDVGARAALAMVLRAEVPLERIEPFAVPLLRDARPFNEYFLLRDLAARLHRP